MFFVEMTVKSTSRVTQPENSSTVAVTKATSTVLLNMSFFFADNRNPLTNPGLRETRGGSHFDGVSHWPNLCARLFTSAEDWITVSIAHRMNKKPLECHV
jgi:hypothetical protein